jgi:hypothetical protein
MLHQEEALPIYIYGLYCPIANTIRYVGKSTKPAKRLNAHMCGARSFAYDHHTARWLRKLDAAGLRPSVVILHEVKPGEWWQDIERSFISTASDHGWDLTNTTAGGEGLDYTDPEADRRYREKLSRAHKVIWSTPERRAEARARSLAFAADPKRVADRNSAIRLAYESPSVRAKVAKASREIAARPGVNEARSIKMKAAWRDPSYRNVVTAARNDPAFTEQQSERLKQRWRDPVARKKMNSARWTPERRHEQAERIRARNTKRSSEG